MNKYSDGEINEKKSLDDFLEQAMSELMKAVRDHIVFGAGGVVITEEGIVEYKPYVELLNEGHLNKELTGSGSEE